MIPAIVFGFGDFTTHLLSGSVGDRLELHAVNFPSLLPSESDIKLPKSVEDLIGPIDAVADALRLKSFVLIGFSISGTVAMDYAIRNPGRVRALMMLNSPPCWTSELRTHQRAVQETMLSAEKKARLESLQSQFTERLPTIDPNAVFAEQCRAQEPLYWRTPPSASIDAEVFGNLRINMDLIVAFETPLYMGHDASGSFSALETPVLLTLGDHDFATHPSSWDLARTLPPQLRVHRFKESGHYPMVEEPEGFARVVHDWLDEAVGERQV